MASSGPARRALAVLAGRLVAIKGWERLGYVRLADYGRERLGMGARELYDLARTDAKLAELPAVEAALLSGLLSWSRVRLVVRVATAEDEVRWIALARRLPVRLLEREVRRVDRGALEAGAGWVDDEEGLPRRTIEVRCTYPVRGLWRRVQDLARRVSGERVAPWQAMEAVVAEVMSAFPPDRDALAECEAERARWASTERDPSDAENVALNGARTIEAAWLDRDPLRKAFASVGGADVPPVAARDCAGTREAMSVLTREAMSVLTRERRTEPDETRHLLLLEEVHSWTGDAGVLDPFELDGRLRALVRHEQRFEARLGPLLAEAVTAREYRLRGYPSLDAWARDGLGISPTKVRVLLRLERLAWQWRALWCAYREGKLSWVQARVLLPLVGVDHARRWDRAWVAWAARVTVRRLEQDVERAVQLAAADPRLFFATGGLPEALESGDRQMCAKPMAFGGGVGGSESAECVRFFFTAPRDVALLARAVLCTVRRRMERALGRLPSEGEAMEEMFIHAWHAWGGDDRVPKRQAVFAREGWLCAVPGCTSSRNLQEHHVVYRSRGGGDEFSNRVALCAFHHLRGEHAHTIRITGRAPHGLRFELGVRSDRDGGGALVTYRSGDLLA